MNKSKTQPRLLGECELLAEKDGKRNLLLTDNAIARSQTTLRVCLSKARSKHVTQTSEVSALESP